MRSPPLRLLDGLRTGLLLLAAPFTPLRVRDGRLWAGGTRLGAREREALRGDIDRRGDTCGFGGESDRAICWRDRERPRSGDVDGIVG